MQRWNRFTVVSCKLIAIAIAIGLVPNIATAQLDPLDFVTSTLITDNDPLTNELARDRVSINSTPFKNQSIVTAGDYQFTTFYREDGRLLIARRDLQAAGNDWDIRTTQFTSFNIDDSHNVPVLGLDGEGYLHLAWGTHVNPLLYTRSTTPVTSGQAMAFTGDTVGNSAALNTMTGMHETQTTYPNFLSIPGTGDLLFNYRTGSSGNGIYRISHYDTSADTWTFTDVQWIERVDARGITYNAYPHNMVYDSDGGLHATWTFRYNSSSPTGNSGFQTNHNIMYGFSPDNGATWFRDPEGTNPYTGVIDDLTSEVIVPIPEGSSLINTGTQAIDANDNLGIASWWAPQTSNADFRRQYMFVGYDGDDWFTSQITHRLSDPFTAPVPETQLGVNHMGRPQIVFDDYNRAFVIYKDADRGGVITVAYSQAESRDDWEFIDLTTTDLGRYEPTIDRDLWDSQRQLHLLVQTIDGNSANGGTPASIVEWDAASAMGRVIKWTGQSSGIWNTSAQNFTHLGTPDEFASFDNVTFDNSAPATTITINDAIDAGKVVIDSDQAFQFVGRGSLTHGSLSVVGGGSLDLVTSGNSYSGPTRVSNATLTISGDANAIVSTIIAADGGRVVLNPTDAANMASAFEIWPTGILEIGQIGSTANVFSDNPTTILNDGLLRVNVSENISGVTGRGKIEAVAGVTTLAANAGFTGQVNVGSAATVLAVAADGLGASSAVAEVDDGGQLRIDFDGVVSQQVTLAGLGGGNGALQVASGRDVTFARGASLGSPETSIAVADTSVATITLPVNGSGGLVKQGTGALRLSTNNTYLGATRVDEGLLIVDSATGFGDTTVGSAATFESGGLVRGNLTTLAGAVVRVGESSPLASGVVYTEDFTGSGQLSLNGRLPTTSIGGQVWAAHPSIAADGRDISVASGASATLPLEVETGFVYTLDASFANVVGDTDWFAIGFLENPTNRAAGDRFIGDPTTGKAWMIFRGDNPDGSTNNTFLGTANSGTQNPVAWPALNLDGGAIDLRIVLDTTGGVGNYTAEFFAKLITATDYTQLRAPSVLASEDIGAVGFAVSQSDVIGDITHFSLSRNDNSSDPEPGLHVAGDFALVAGAELQLQITSPTDHQRITVGGHFDQQGTLAVSLAMDASVPSAGDSFDIIDAATTSGLFERLLLPSLPTGLLWDNSLIAADGTISVIDGLAGDFNGDGKVDAADYTVWRDSLGAQGVALVADANSDLNVDAQDYLFWRSNFGQTFASLSVSADSVPEPTAILLLSVSAILALATRSRQSNRSENFIALRLGRR